MGKWGAEVSSVEGVSVDVVVFEVGLSVQVGGITTIGPRHADDTPPRASYGSNSPHVGTAGPH